MKNHFIRTSDEHTATILREAGLPELAKEGKYWVFVNKENKQTFSSDDMKLNYSNKLCF